MVNKPKLNYLVPEHSLELMKSVDVCNLIIGPNGVGKSLFLRDELMFKVQRRSNILYFGPNRTASTLAIRSLIAVRGKGDWIKVKPKGGFIGFANKTITAKEIEILLSQMSFESVVFDEYLSDIVAFSKLFPDKARREKVWIMAAHHRCLELNLSPLKKFWTTVAVHKFNRVGKEVTVTTTVVA